MANRRQPRVPISRTNFLKMIRSKGYTIDSLAKEIGISGKTIQRALSDGEIMPWLRQQIALFVGVDPSCFN